jgi:2-oxoglutarate ferredoxin oxidoreductase subunit beta
MLAHMGPPEFPVPIGVFRSVDEPSYETAVHDQITEITERKGVGDLHALLHSGDVWEVE